MVGKLNHQDPMLNTKLVVYQTHSITTVSCQNATRLQLKQALLSGSSLSQQG